MNREMNRVIGFILYHKEKVVERACNFCVRVGELETSDICEYCKSMAEHPNYQEEKKYFLEDWYDRKDGNHEKDWPWEQTLTDEALALLKDVEGEVYTADEVVEIVRRVVNAILTTPTQRLEEIVNEMFLKEGITLKKLDENLKVIEVE